MTYDLAERQVQEFTFSVQIPGGAYITRKLKDGEMVSVGSSATADLRLESPGIAGMHCLLTLEDGRVNIKDCYSPSGTYVNGQKIQDIQVNSGCTIRLDQIEIAINKKGEQSPPPAFSFDHSASISTGDSTTYESLSEQTEAVLETMPETMFETPLIEKPVPEDLTEEISQLLNELEESKSENQVLQERLESLPKQESASEVATAEVDPFQTEMIDLMRQEIEALQQELEKRNSEDFAFDLNSQSLPTEELPAREEVEKLVDRLEDLLNELQEKDEHVQVLQDLVLAGDTANQAEQEEREQLAKWLGEFEQRFELMSDEREAENDYLKRQVQKLEEERAAAITALAADSQSAKAEALRRLTDSLRAEVSESQTEIHLLKDANLELRNQLEKAQNTTPREEEVRLACERAEIARMRHDVELRLQKLHKSRGGTDETEGEVELKIRNLTQELRGSNKKDNTGSSLSGRILSLWGRLNG